MTNALLLRRRGMMAAQGGLPYDAEVEYLEGTGTQWIDTGIKPDATMIVEVSYQDFSGTSSVMFGSRNGPNNRMFAFGSHNETQVRGDCMAQTYYHNYVFDIGVRHEVSLTNSGYNIDGVNYALFNPQFTGNNYNIYLFALNNGGNVVNMLKPVKMKSASIRNRDYYYYIDLISVRVGSVGYMYDRVSGQLFGNAGTGDFLLGPDIQ